MQTHPKLMAGQITLKGVGQQLGDGRWSAQCVVTEHLGDHTDDRILPAPGTFNTEQEAVSAGLHCGIAWVDATYPLE